MPQPNNSDGSFKLDCFLGIGVFIHSIFRLLPGVIVMSHSLTKN